MFKSFTSLSFFFATAAAAYWYLAPYTNITKQTRSRNSTSVPDLSPVDFAIIVSTRFSAYFTLPIFQPWANVVSSVAKGLEGEACRRVSVRSDYESLIFFFRSMLCL